MKRRGRTYHFAIDDVFANIASAYRRIGILENNEAKASRFMSFSIEHDFAVNNPTKAPKVFLELL